MLDQVLQLLGSADSYSAVSYLTQSAEPPQALKSIDEIVRHLYWQEKDIWHTVALGRAGIQFGLDSARASSSPEITESLLSTTKTLSYNLASYVWPGWEEPGIVLDRSLLRVGKEAAELNLRLAIELGKPDLTLARAYWMIGAHALAENDLVQSKDYFEQCLAYANSAESQPDQNLANGYLALLKKLETPSTPEWDIILQKIAQQDNAEFFTDQLTKALRIFSR